MKAVVSSITYLVLTLLLCALVSTATFGQNLSDAWANSQEPTQLVETREYTSDASLRAKLGLHTGTSCVQETILLGSSGGSVQDCWYTSPLGKHSAYGNFFLPDGLQHAGFVGVDAQTRFIPLYGNTHLLVLNPSIDGGFSLSFYRYGGFSVEVLTTYGEGLHAYDIVSEPDFTITTNGGSPWLPDENMLYTGFWFSQNGRYLILANYTDENLLRIDLATYEIVYFEYAHMGTNAYGNFSITDDGRWITMNVYGKALALLDVHSCSRQPGIYGQQLLACSTRDLAHRIATELPGTGGHVYWANFVRDYVIELHTSAYTSTDGYEKFLLYAPGTYKFGTNYLALGDSYASGEGARDYYTGTDVEGNRCHLSRVSYPFLLGQQLGLSSANSVACSGARIVNVMGPEKISDNKNDLERSNQADNRELNNELGVLTPGWILQTLQINPTGTDIITVSISGNDADFTNFIAECAKPGTCFQNDTERMSPVYKIQKQYSRLVELYGTLRASLAPDARIYALGYPQLLSDSYTCSNNSMMSRPERTLARGLTDYLNYVIELAAQRAGVTYVDLSEALAGHRLCDTSSKSAMHGLNVGTSDAHDNFTSQESFHPTAFGHQLIAQTIREQTDDFTIMNPRPRPHAQQPSVMDAVSFAIVTQPIAEQFIDAIYYASFYDGDIILRSKMISGTFVDHNSRYYDFAPSSPFVIQLYSEPVTLGTFMTDSSGSLAYEFAIPESVAPGFHRIRAFGVNAAGRPIELRQVIYVAASEDDWDGDGRPNSKQPCLITLTDQDGVPTDHWCDNPQEPTLDEPAVLDSSTAVGNSSAHSSAAPRNTAAQLSQSVTAASNQPNVTSLNSHPGVAVAFHENFAATTEPTPPSQLEDSAAWRTALLIALAAIALLLVCYWYIRKRVSLQ